MNHRQNRVAILDTRSAVDNDAQRCHTENVERRTVFAISVFDTPFNTMHLSDFPLTACPVSSVVPSTSAADCPQPVGCASDVSPHSGKHDSCGSRIGQTTTDTISHSAISRPRANRNKRCHFHLNKKVEGEK
jgi:hypothetical protein